jgi:hypothetical protein
MTRDLSRSESPVVEHCFSYSQPLTPNISYSDTQVELLNPTMSCLEEIKSMEEECGSGLDLANSRVTPGNGDGAPSPVASSQQPACQLQSLQTTTIPPSQESIVSMPVDVDDYKKEMSRTQTVIHHVPEKISTTLNISVYPDDTDDNDEVLIQEELMDIRMESEFERFRLKRSPTVSFHGDRGSTLMVSDSHSNLSDYDDDDFNDELNDELFSQDNSIGRESVATFSTPEASPSLPGNSGMQDAGASQSDLLLGVQGHDSLEHPEEEDELTLLVSIELLSLALYLINDLTLYKRTLRVMKINHWTMKTST